MNSKTIYTCLTGGYDELLQPEVIDKTFDYICFSNDIPEKQVGVWQIREIPFETNDNSRLSRYPKILPHKVLSEYEYSVYMDANIQITSQKFYDIVNNKIEADVLVAQVPHPFEDCVYEEIRFAFRVNKVDFIKARNQYLHLKTEGYPCHYGLYENNLIFRKHNDDLVKRIMSDWFNEYIDYAKRDQFSLVFVYWKNNFKPDLFFEANQNARNVTFLKFYERHAAFAHPSLMKRLKQRFLSIFFPV